MSVGSGSGRGIADAARGTSGLPLARLVKPGMKIFAPGPRDPFRTRYLKNWLGRTTPSPDGDVDYGCRRLRTHGVRDGLSEPREANNVEKAIRPT